MATITTCPSCQRRLNVPDDLIGRLVKCPMCATEFTGGDTPGSPPLPAGPETSAPQTEDKEVGEGPIPPRPAAREEPAGEERPWEGPGRHGVRRDCEPHRGSLVLVLGILSLVLLSVCCLAPVAMGLGIGAWTIGRRDLGKIDAGLMDPEGRGLTQAGYICGIIGTLINALLLLGCIGYFALAILASAAQHR
jgi:hypothetical protein